MKLGLKIIETFKGEQPAGTIINNNSVLQRYASSARSYIDGLENFYGTSKILHFVRYLGNEGLLICIVQAQPDGSARAKDNSAAWIHIPSRIDIEEDDFDNVLSKTKKFLSGNLSESDLNDLYSKTYSEKNVLFTIIDTIQSDSNGKLGALYYDKNTLHSFRELCNLQFLANKSFGKYRAILLINNSDEIKMLGENTLTSSNLALNQIVTLLPPEMKYDFTPFVRGLVFNSAIEALKDERLIVIWRKNGYKDIEKTVIVKDNDDFQRTVEVQDSDIIREIPRSIFQIVDKENNFLIKKCVVSINDIHFLDNKIYIKNSDYLRGVTIRVTADGYNTHVEHSVSLGNRIVVLMTPTIYEKEYILPAKHGDNIDRNIKVTLESVGERIYNSPFKGYKIKNDSFKYGNQLKLKAKYFLLGVALSFVVLGLSYALYQSNNSKDSSNTPEDNPSKTVISYLEDSDVWTKTVMRTYKLDDLFEALNSYKSEEVEKKYEELNGGKKLNVIVDKIKQLRGPDLKYLREGTFTNGDTIKYKDYISKLDNAKGAVKRYLDDSNRKWERDTLEKFAPGLFDALITYDFDRIKECGQKLKESENLSEIEKAIPKKKEQKTKFKGRKYDDNGDSIDIGAYINKLKGIDNQKESPSTNNNENNEAPDNIMGGRISTTEPTPEKPNK